MNYTEATAKLGNRESRKLENNTYLQRRSDGSIAVKLHNTDVVTFLPDGRTVLNSGGYRTVTTKDRINKFISGAYVSQQKGIWYICGKPDRTLHCYREGTTIMPDGTIKTGATVSDKEAEGQELAKRNAIKKYAHEFILALQAGKVDPPRAGDCFYCQMKEAKTGKPLGEVTRDAEHLRSHIEEKYFVGSLLWNALESQGASIAARESVAAVWQGRQNVWANQAGFLWKQIEKALSKYIMRQMGVVS